MAGDRVRTEVEEVLMKFMEDSMPADYYQKLCARTINGALTEDQMRKHSVLGLVSEVGELCGLHQKVYQGHELDETHAKKELGDILWFVAEYCTVHGWNLSDVMKTNIEKLRERYPSGFDEYHSIHRKNGDI